MFLILFGKTKAKTNFSIWKEFSTNYVKNHSFLWRLYKGITSLGQEENPRKDKKNSLESMRTHGTLNSDIIFYYYYMVDQIRAEIPSNFSKVIEFLPFYEKF